MAKNPPAISFKTSTFKSNSEACQSFYKDFLKCGNFATWLRLRTIAAQNELRRRYLEILSLGDVAGWVKGRNEVELVDLLVRMREELGNSANSSDLLDIGPKSRSRSDNDGSWSGDLTDGRGSYMNNGQRNHSPSPSNSGSHNSSSDTELHGITPSPSPDPPQTRRKPRSSSTPTPSHGQHYQQGSNGSTGPKPIPVQRIQKVGGQYSNASSFSSTSSRTATPSRSSSSSSLNLGPSETTRDREQGSRGAAGSRESSPERQRRRYAPEASVIKPTHKQKEQLRDQIRLLIEALPVDLRESLKANEAKKRSMATAASFEGL